MPKNRRADIFAGKGSLASALKARRKAVESGDLQGAPAAFERDLKKAKPKKK